MVVTPEEAMAITQQERRNLHDLEQKIDHQLKIKFNCEAVTPVFVEGSYLNMRAHILDALLERYVQAGWEKVERGRRSGKAKFDFHYRNTNRIRNLLEEDGDAGIYARVQRQVYGSDEDAYEVRQLDVFRRQINER